MSTKQNLLLLTQKIKRRSFFERKSAKNPTKNIFQAVIDSPLSDQEKEVLTFLYQPIVGANAFSLYWLLLSETTDSEENGSLFHADLISLLDLSCQQLEEACYKLEGIGLLETYKNRSGIRRLLFILFKST